jgi:hypothetical protein
MSGFFFPDTSPIFSYSPCSNCGDPDSWQSAYSPRGDGYDVTFHQSPSASSAIQFNVSGESPEPTKSGHGDMETDKPLSFESGSEDRSY